MSETLRVHALHALGYCERLFYLEEVENLRVADGAVYAGRRLHVEIERGEEEGEWLTLTLESERWGLAGRVDCVRRRDGMIVPYEHKRGRAARGHDGAAEAWRSDRLQVVAYALLVEEHAGREVMEGRVRYHADNVTVRVAVDAAARSELAEAVERARALQALVERPPVTENERLCVRCSLAPVCLPEEARLAGELAGEWARVASPLAAGQASSSSSLAASPLRQRLRLFPAEEDRRTLHVVTQGARVGRKGDRLEVSARDEAAQLHPVHEVGQVVLHGFAQITTQALRLCAEQEIGVHWVTTGGRYTGAWVAGSGGAVQRRIRQYRALTDEAFCLALARRLAEARARGQLSLLLRASREGGAATTAGRNDGARAELTDASSVTMDEAAAAIEDAAAFEANEQAGTTKATAEATTAEMTAATAARPEVRAAIAGMRRLLGPLSRASSLDSLRGYEGNIGAHYFAALPHVIVPEAGALMRPDGRSRRPPRDRCNALLSYGYALLLKDVMNAIIVVGLDPALGFYHQPRSQAAPLALDLMELFRVPLVDLPVVASINRRQWDAEADFTIAGQQVWLSDAGRKKFIAVYERRKADVWKHPVIGHSLSYARLLELEVRLLEKEWLGNDEGGLFARMRLR